MSSREACHPKKHEKVVVTMISWGILVAHQRKDSLALEVVTYLFILWMMPLWCFAGTQREAEQDQLPSHFKIYSQSGNETFYVECRPVKADSVTCNFMGARINPGRDGETTSHKRDFDKLSPLERKQLQEEFARDARASGDTAKSTRDKLNDPNLGPKTKAFLQQYGAAYGKGDLPKVLELMAQRERQTCTADTQSFSLTFQRFGNWKWVSNPGPGGFCNILKVYELNGVSFRDEKGAIVTVQWKMIETRVAADSSQPMCRDVANELHKPTVWSWDSPSEYELPCDFIHFRSLLSH